MFVATLAFLVTSLPHKLSFWTPASVCLQGSEHSKMTCRDRSVHTFQAQSTASDCCNSRAAPAAPSVPLKAPDLGPQGPPRRNRDCTGLTFCVVFREVSSCCDDVADQLLPLAAVAIPVQARARAFFEADNAPGRYQKCRLPNAPGLPAYVMSCQAPLGTTHRERGLFEHRPRSPHEGIALMSMSDVQIHENKSLERQQTEMHLQAQ